MLIGSSQLLHPSSHPLPLVREGLTGSRQVEPQRRQDRLDGVSHEGAASGIRDRLLLILDTTNDPTKSDWVILNKWHGFPCAVEGLKVDVKECVFTDLFLDWESDIQAVAVFHPPRSSCACARSRPCLPNDPTLKLMLQHTDIIVKCRI